MKKFYTFTKQNFEKSSVIRGFIAVTLLCVMAIFSATAQTQVVFSDTLLKFENMPTSNSGSPSVSGTINSFLSYSTTQGDANNNTCYWTSKQIRLYCDKTNGNGSSLTFKTNNGVKIKEIMLHRANSDVIPLAFNVNGGADTTINANSSKYFVLSDIVADSLKLRNAYTGSTTKTLQIDTIKITYFIPAYDSIYTVTVCPGYTYTSELTQGTEYPVGTNMVIDTLPAQGFVADTLIHLVVNALADTDAVTCEYPIEVVVDSAAHGSISCNMNTIYYKSTPAYTVAADPCYEIAEIAVNGTPIDLENKQLVTYIFDSVKTLGNEISVSFKEIHYTVDVTFDGISYAEEHQEILCADTFAYELPSVVGSHLTAVTEGSDTIELVENGGVQSIVIDSVGANRAFVAHYELNQYAMNYTAPENGSLTGPATALYGDEPVYTFVPETCYQIASVSVDGEDVTSELVGDLTASATYTFAAIDTDHVIAVNYEQITYELTTIYTGNGFGHANPETATVVCHDTVLYTINAGTGSYIQSYAVTRDGSTHTVALGTHMQNYTFSIDHFTSDVTVKVTLNRYTENVTTATATAHGTICCDTTVLYADSCTVRVNADAANGYHIDYITNGTDTTFYGREDVEVDYTTYDIVTDITITAAFAINEYRIVTNVTPEGKAVVMPIDTVVNYGESCNINIVSDDCHYIVAVADSGAAGTTWVDRTVPEGATAYTIAYDEVTNDHVLAVTLAANQFTITGNNYGHGTTPTVAADCGAPYTYTITADEGYHVAQVKLGTTEVYRASGSEQLSSWSYDFAEVLNDTTFNVVFSINKYTVSASVTPSRLSRYATISGVPTGAVNHGTTQVVTITPDDCYHISELLVNGEDMLADSIVDANNVVTYTFTIEDTTAIVATIEKMLYNLTWEVVDSANGTISVEDGAGRAISTENIKGTLTRNCGAAADFVISAAENYHIASINHNGVITNNTDNALTDTTIAIAALSQDESVKVEFALNQYTVTTIVGGTNLVAQTIDTVYHGATDTLNFAAPDEYHHIVSVVCGDSTIYFGANDDQTYTYYMENIVSDTTITVHFALDTLTTTFVVADNGTINRLDGFDAYFDNAFNKRDWNGKPKVFADNAPVTGRYTGAGVYTISYLANPFVTIRVEVTPNTCYQVDTVVYINVTSGDTLVYVQPATTIYSFNASEEHSFNANFVQLEYAMTGAVSGTHGTITETGSVLCGEEFSYTITPEVGYHVENITINTVTDPAYLNNLVPGENGEYTYTFTNVTEDKDVVVTFAIDQFTVAANFTDGNGIFTPANTTALYGDTVTFDIALLSSCEHVDSLVINGESVAVDSLVSGSEYQMVVTSNVVIEATTTVNHYMAAANVTGNGAVSEAVVNCNDPHVYTIVPDEGWHIASYTFNGVTTTLGGNDDVYASVTVDNVLSDTTIYVVFERNVFTLVAQVDRGIGSWNVDTIRLSYGDSYDFIATADAANGWHVDRIICGDSVAIFGNATDAQVTYTINPVVSDTLLRAYFAINQYTVSASATGDGTITPAGDSIVIDRATIDYAINAQGCSYISQVLVDGTPVEVTDSFAMTYTLANITAPHTVEAIFTPHTYYMASVAYGEGTVNEGYANCDGSFTYDVVANYGYHIDRVVLDGELYASFNNQDSVYSLPISNPETNHLLEAYFSINHYTVTASAGEHGTIMLPGAFDVTHGQSMNFTIHAEDCYHIRAINVCGTDVVTFDSNVDLYTFSLPYITCNKIVTADFAINTYNVTATAGEHGAITPAGETTYNCGDNVTYTFTPDAGYEIADVVINGTSAGVIPATTITGISADYTIEVSFVATTYNVSAVAYGNGQVSPAAATVLAGDSATFTFTPADCYTLSEVLVNGVSYLDQVVDNVLVINDVRANLNVVASYQINTFAVTAIAGVGGSITESNVYNCGTDVTYEISVDPCYTIASVEIDGVNQPIQTSYTFAAIDSAHTINVTFNQNTYTVDASVNDNALGTISHAGNNTYNCGETIDFVIAPVEGAYIVNVVVDGEDMGAIDHVTLAQINANHTVVANFAQYTYTVNAYANGHVTTVPALGETTVTYGSSLAYNFTVEPCYEITDVIVNGVSNGALNGYTFLDITENSTLQIVVEAITYTINATVNNVNGGSINPMGETEVACGASQSYTITAANGYYISDVLVNGSSVGVVNSYIFENVSADNTIEAQFAAYAELQYTISASAGANGTINPVGDTIVNRGESVTYRITPDEFYTIGDVLVDSVSVGAVSTYTFSNVTADHTISVVFVAAECTVPTYVYTTDVTATTATLNWSDMGAASYTVRYKKLSEEDFTEVTGITTTSYDLTGLDQMTEYVWNVKSVCVEDEAESNWSSQVRFATIASGINENNFASVNVYSYGNNIYVANNGQEMITKVQVYDMFGRVIYEGQAQNNPEVIGVTAATGNYIVRVVTDKQVHNYKVNIFQK